MIVDVLRPLSVRFATSTTAVPGGTVADVTSDDSDATYANTSTGLSSNGWSCRMEQHVLSAGYGRHALRGRVRALTDAGTLNATIFPGRGTDNSIISGNMSVNSVVAEYSTAWSSAAAFGLDTVAGLTDLNLGAGNLTSASGATALRVTEAYVDVDTRLWPDYTPMVKDAAGVDRSGGVVGDTNQPTLWFGGVAYDDLPALAWAVTVTGVTSGLMFDASGSGTPPESIPVTTGLPDEAYTVVFTVSSLIRETDAFEHEQTVEFTLNNVVPPPSPPLLTVEREGDGYRLTWEFPGGQTWDDDYVIAEVWRDDCTGSSRIATVEDGLNGSYLDMAIPQLDPLPVNVDGECTSVADTCDLTYRVRYWGYVSTTVTIPASIPVQLVLAWPGQNSLIPAGWLRVTALDGYYPRGSSGVIAPVTTGGAASHTHTTPSHTHVVSSHQHAFSGTTVGSSTSTTTERANGLPITIANQSHSHTLPALTGYSNAPASGTSAAGTVAGDNVPPTRDVIWIRSDGSATQYPVGVLGYSTENVSGWTTDSTSSGRFLKGAAAAGNGGAISGASTHTHVLSLHTHTSPSHDHADGVTGLSGPAAATEARSGSGTPRWLARHTHPFNPIATTAGAFPSVSGGTSGSATLEPTHRRLRILRNTSGGAQTRIIGLYTGAVADLPASMNLCDGTNGTPDMRGYFARDVGTASVNTTGGAATHSHTTPNHGHGFVSHFHEVTIGESTYSERGRDTSGDQGSVPTATHTHTVHDTEPELVSTGLGGQGSTDTVSHLPAYHEVHFARLDGTVDGGVLPTPELRTSDYAEFTVEAIDFGDGMDRISVLESTGSLAVVADRGSGYPRISIDSTPLDGGVHTVATTAPGEDVTVSISVVGKAAIDELELLLAADRVYWAPLGGQPGWFAPRGWSVEAPAPDVKVASLIMVRSDWPDTDDPESFL